MKKVLSGVGFLICFILMWHEPETLSGNGWKVFVLYYIVLGLIAVLFIIAFNQTISKDRENKE